MVRSYSRRPAPNVKGRQEEFFHGFGAVVIVNGHEGHKVTFAGYRGVNNEFPLDELMVAVGMPNGVDERNVVFPALDGLACADCEIFRLQSSVDSSDLLSCAWYFTFASQPQAMISPVP